MHLFPPGGCRNISVLFAITGREDITQSRCRSVHSHWWQMWPLLTLKGLPLLHKSSLNMRQQLGSSNCLHFWSQRKQSQSFKWSLLGGMHLKGTVQSKIKNVIWMFTQLFQTKLMRQINTFKKKKWCRIFTQNLHVNFKQLQERHWIENEHENL